jgi:Na+-transporting NADH:ubiquinone oxidoreductase subunit NqrE
MSALWSLFLTAAFVDNMPLTCFSGSAPSLRSPSDPDAAFGLGVAITGVLGVTVPLNHLIYAGLLAPGRVGLGRPAGPRPVLSVAHRLHRRHRGGGAGA